MYPYYYTFVNISPPYYLSLVIILCLSYTSSIIFSSFPNLLFNKFVIPSPNQSTSLSLSLSLSLSFLTLLLRIIPYFTNISFDLSPLFYLFFCPLISTSLLHFLYPFIFLYFLFFSPHLLFYKFAILSTIPSIFSPHMISLSLSLSQKNKVTHVSHEDKVVIVVTN